VATRTASTGSDNGNASFAENRFIKLVSAISAVLDVLVQPESPIVNINDALGLPLYNINRLRVSSVAD
jgi:hypothetical protein